MRGTGWRAARLGPRRGPGRRPTPRRRPRQRPGGNVRWLLVGGCAFGTFSAFNRPGHLSAREDIELAKDVAQVRLDGLGAEEERSGDLGVRFSVDHETRDLELALRERPDSDAVGLSGACSSVDAVTELSQFALRLVAVAQRAALVEFGDRALQFGCGAVSLPGLGECAAGERS